MQDYLDLKRRLLGMFTTEELLEEVSSRSLGFFDDSVDIIKYDILDIKQYYSKPLNKSLLKRIKQLNLNMKKIQSEKKKCVSLISNIKKIVKQMQKEKY